MKEKNYKYYRKMDYETGEFILTEEEKKDILIKRAEMLARDISAESEGERTQIVEFILAGERYGIEAIYVREIFPLKDLTPIPCTPSFITGVINVRHEIVSVMDIKKFFNLPECGITELNKVIILKTDDMEVGILADSITGVTCVDIDGLQTFLPGLTDIGAEYLKGIAEGPLIILDGEKILSDKKLIVSEEVE
ncbi:MAG: chemotaxis protein CheW [Candidatus Eremiobacterota bacterium]